MDATYQVIALPGTAGNATGAFVQLLDVQQKLFWRKIPYDDRKESSRLASSTWWYPAQSGRWLESQLSNSGEEDKG